MDIPKNCWECKHGNNCKAAHYGGSMCKHKEEINRKAINAILSGKPKN